MGLIRKNNDGLDTAEKLMRKVIEIDNNHAHGHNNLATILNSRDDKKGAEKHLLKALALAPDYEAPLQTLTVLYLQENNPVEAEKFVTRAVRISPNDAGNRDLWGIILRKLRNFSRSLEEHKKAVKLAPNFPAYYANLGICYTELVLNDEALKCHLKSVELDPKFLDGYINLSHHYQFVFKAKGLEKAKEALNQALDAGLQSEKIYERLATIHMVQAEDEMALEMALKALEINPNSPSANKTMSEICAKLNKPQEAMRYGEKSVELDSTDASAHVSYGEACLRARAFEDAISSFDVCLDNPLMKHAEALAFKTIALREMGDHTAAKKITDLDEFIYVSKLGIPEGFDSVEEFNAALEADIKKHPTLEKAPTGFAARNSFLTNDLQTPLFEKVEILLRNKVEDYIAQLSEEYTHTFIDDTPREYFMRIWGTLSNNEGYIDSHIHREGWISAAYYIKLPASVDEGGTEGWIEFGKPSSDFLLEEEFETRRIKPELGSIVMFPSFYYHRTLPYTGDGERLSISFDLQSLNSASV